MMFITSFHFSKTTEENKKINYWTSFFITIYYARRGLHFDLPLHWSEEQLLNTSLISSQLPNEWLNNYVSKRRKKSAF